MNSVDSMLCVAILVPIAARDTPVVQLWPDDPKGIATMQSPTKALASYTRLVKTKAMAVDLETKVFVVDTTWTGSAHVRMVEGPFADDGGWTFRESVR